MNLSFTEFTNLYIYKTSQNIINIAYTCTTKPVTFYFKRKIKASLYNITTLIKKVKYYLIYNRNFEIFYAFGMFYCDKRYAPILYLGRLEFNNIIVRKERYYL